MRGGVLNLLPSKIVATKRAEDQVFRDADSGAESKELFPLLRIVDRHEIRRFWDEIADFFDEGRFLELGGETCFASALHKTRTPSSTVYASDVAPYTLRTVAYPTCALFPDQPDFFVALDAEEIPFKDETVTSVFAMSMIHHLPNPEKMFQDVHRILRRGGVFIAIDHSIPRHFKWAFRNTAQRRAQEHGIQEELLSPQDWSRVLEKSPLPKESLNVYTNPEYQYDPIHILLGYIIDRLPKTIARWLFPTGVLIHYQKP